MQCKHPRKKQTRWKSFILGLKNGKSYHFWEEFKGTFSQLGLVSFLSSLYLEHMSWDQTFIATEDTGQQLGCLLSPRITQRALYICPNWNQLKNFTSNCFATGSGAFSGSEFFMKWFCFPQNISIFHWEPEQANQETRWNTSVLNGHHSTPEASSPSCSRSLLGTLPPSQTTFPNNALARKQCWCTPSHLHKRRILFIMEDAMKSRSHHFMFICWDLQSSTT